MFRPRAPIETLVAVAGSALLLGLLVLSTRTGPLSQMIGVLRLENAIALFELGAPAHHEALGIRVGQTAILLVSIAFFRWYLLHLTDADAPAASEAAVL